MSTPEGVSTGKVGTGAPGFGIVNQPVINHTVEFPTHINRPPAIPTGQPVIEITCSVCGELTARTYPIEANGEKIPTAPDERYSCSCPSPSDVYL